MADDQDYGWFDQLEANDHLEWFETLERTDVPKHLVWQIPKEQREGLPNVAGGIKAVRPVAAAYFRPGYSEDVSEVVWHVTPDFRAFLERRRDQQDK